MSGDRILSVMEKFGADIPGAMARFLDDSELYETCIRLFAEDGNFAALGLALREGECRKAFEAAHGLKGVAANLGLTPVLSLISEIVEPLRKNCMDGLQPKYDELMRKMAELKALI